MEYNTIYLRDNAELFDEAADWFHSKWGVDKQAYLDSMNESLNGGAVPQWYIMTDGGRIIGGMGVIENDFHERTDLAPNVCAVYVEEDYRKQGIAKYLLDLVCSDMAARGVDTLYLITSHTEFYERCGWEYFCDVKEDNGKTARMYRHITK